MARDAGFRERLLCALEDKGPISGAELAKMFRKPPTLVNRNLRALDQQSLVRRHGGKTNAVWDSAKIPARWDRWVSQEDSSNGAAAPSKRRSRRGLEGILAKLREELEDHEAMARRLKGAIEELEGY